MDETTITATRLGYVRGKDRASIGGRMIGSVGDSQRESKISIPTDETREGRARLI